MLKKLGTWNDLALVWLQSYAHFDQQDFWNPLFKKNKLLPHFSWVLSTQFQ